MMTIELWILSAFIVAILTLYAVADECAEDIMDWAAEDEEES